MSQHPELSGENFSHKTAAIFASESLAIHAADAVRAALDPTSARVSVLFPSQAQIGRAMEPERKGILLTLVRAHLWSTLFGAIAGTVLLLVLAYAGVAWVTQSPLLSAAVATGFGAVAGLMLGGLITLRPDHSPYIEAVREANGEGRTVVIVHAASGKVGAEAEHALDQLGGHTVRTL